MKVVVIMTVLMLLFMYCTFCPSVQRNARLSRLVYW